MTDYTNSRNLIHMKKWIKDAPWFRGKVIGKAGTFPLGEISNSQTHIQFDKLYSMGANIRKSDKDQYPESVTTEMKSLLRKLKYFNSLIELDDPDYQDFLAGDDYQRERVKSMIDNVAYQYDQDLEKWYVGYGTTFTDDPDYDDKWVPWFSAASTSGSTPSNPGDMNDKVTNKDGTTGTTATILDMGTVLTSTSTNQTIDFVRQTFQPIIRAFTSFKDSNNGRRMVRTNDSVNTTAKFSFLAAPELIQDLQIIRPYDGEKILTNTNIKAQMEALGIELIPCDDFTASLEEDGTCQFGFVGDFKRNFKIGLADKMFWYAFKEIPNINSKWIKKMKSRHAPLSVPYRDGTNWYKAFFHGYFTYMNDSA